MIYLEKPAQFDPRIVVVSCFLEHDGHILLLHRQDHKPQGDTWGVVAGKVDDEEALVEAMMREIREEIGLTLQADQLSYRHRVFVKYPDLDFEYHIYVSKLTDRPQVRLNSDEHKDHRWVSPRKALKMKLIPDEDSCIKLVYGV